MSCCSGQFWRCHGTSRATGDHPRLALQLPDLRGGTGTSPIRPQGLRHPLPTGLRRDRGLPDADSRAVPGNRSTGRGQAAHAGEGRAWSDERNCGKEGRTWATLGVSSTCVPGLSGGQRRPVALADGAGVRMPSESGRSGHPGSGWSMQNSDALEWNAGFTEKPIGRGEGSAPLEARVPLFLEGGRAFPQVGRPAQVVERARLHP